MSIIEYIYFLGVGWALATVLKDVFPDIFKLIKERDELALLYMMTFMYIVGASFFSWLFVYFHYRINKTDEE